MPRPRVSCCRPWMGPGYRWRHQSTCPEFPNQPVGHEKATPPIRVTHPAGANLPGTLRTWFAHPQGHGCPECRYVEAWMDRDDDEIEAEA